MKRKTIVIYWDFCNRSHHSCREFRHCSCICINTIRLKIKATSVCHLGCLCCCRLAALIIWIQATINIGTKSWTLTVNRTNIYAHPLTLIIIHSHCSTTSAIPSISHASTTSSGPFSSWLQATCRHICTWNYLIKKEI